MEWQTLEGHDEDTGETVLFYRLELPSIQWVLEIDPPRDDEDEGYCATAKPFVDDHGMWDSEFIGYFPTLRKAKYGAMIWEIKRLMRLVDDLVGAGITMKEEDAA